MTEMKSWLMVQIGGGQDDYNVSKGNVYYDHSRRCYDIYCKERSVGVFLCVCVCMCNEASVVIFCFVKKEFGSAVPVHIQWYVFVYVQGGLAIHTHNDMQMDVSQSDANDFIITKNISTVKIELQTEICTLCYPRRPTTLLMCLSL